jgi:cytoskeletal protein CcmA (bactofilin family)
MKHRRVSDVEYQTIIGDETEFSGMVKGKRKSNIRIKGDFKGDIDTRGVVWVDIEGCVDGDITGKHIIISGEVTGDVNAKKTLEIGRSAKIGGVVSAKEVYIESKSSLDDVEGSKKTSKYDEKREYFLNNSDDK